MDAKTLKELGGTITKMTVPFAGKMWNKERTIGGDWGVEVSIPDGEDPEVVGVATYEYLRQIARVAIADDMAEMKAEKPAAEIRQSDALQRQADEDNANEATGMGQHAEAAKPKEGTSKTVKIVKFTLEKRPDKKFELKLYPEIKDAPGKYPEVKYVADRERMWEMLSSIAEEFDFTDLPGEFECNLTANYLIGKEFIIASGAHKGEKSNYKDLVSVK